MVAHNDEPQVLIPASATGAGRDMEGADPETLDDGESSRPAERHACTERHDGWTGQRMAMFCAILAETGIVGDACLAVGMSRTTAYEARRRNPLFAAGWDEALSLARNRLADELLERSLTGCVEKYYRDGELVGEKRIVDNKLGMAILRRLDRLAETGLALHSNLPPAVRPEQGRGTPVEAPDWDLMLAALRTGDEDMMAEAMVQVNRIEAGEADKADNPPNRPPSDLTFEEKEEEEEEEPQRCWWNEDDECWVTNFPPPPGYDDYQRGRWGEEDYERFCTAEESELLEASADAAIAEDQAADEAVRDAWFEALKAAPPAEAAGNNSESGAP